MLDLSYGNYTRDQVVAALHSPHLTYDFRYELLDGLNRVKGDIDGVLSARIDHSSLATIKRSAVFTIAEEYAGEINWLNDRIKPYMRIKMPASRVLAREYAFFSHIHAAEVTPVDNEQTQGWVEYPLGVFLLSSPIRKDDGVAVMREVEAYDGLIVLRDDKFTDRHAITEGTSYYDAIIAILTSAGITQYNIEQTDATLTRDIEFAPGVEKLRAVNELLTQLNYVPMHVDVHGYYTTYQYRSPAERSEEYTYADDAQSITLIGAEEELDLMDVHNVFTAIRSNPDEPPLMSTYINDNPESPTSTVSRGRNIVDIRELDDIASQEALDAYVRRIAFEASQVYGRIRFKTQLMPMHGYADVLRFKYSPLGIDGKYVELSWSMDLQTGGTMTHELRKIVDVGGVTP
ncbi:hypothetical protein [Sporosarcina sp. ITBMC105]